MVYNEVQATKLGRKEKKKRRVESPAAGAVSSTATNSGAAWPPALQQFVNSSFERAESLPEPQKALFNTQIQTLIYSAAQNNKIWSNDWTLQKLPVFEPSVPLVLHQDLPQNSSSYSSNSNSSNNYTLPSTPTGKFDSNDRKRQRAARFANSGRSSPSPAPQTTKSAQIVGTSTALEKRYLRLTSEPDPSVVRPESVLHECLKFVVDKFRTTGASYAYINDQLKAIRQDLTVQHIKNDLAIAVYETHGRIAIENNDLGEFNQCQSQLKHLYDAKSDPSFFQHTYEFTCYRVLYLLLTANFSEACLIKLELLNADSNTVASKLDEPYKSHREAMYKALQLLDFLTTGDYHGFFATYRWFQNLKGMQCAFHLLDQFMAAKQRLLTINKWCKTFKKLPMAYLEEQLALESANVFLTDFNLQHFSSNTDFDCASARATLQQIVDKGTFKKVDIKGQV